MRKNLIIGLLIALLLTIFIIRNNQEVYIYFFWGNPIKGSLPVVLILTIIIGVLIGYAFSYPTQKNLKKKNEDLKAKLEGLEEKTSGVTVISNDTEENNKH